MTLFIFIIILLIVLLWTYGRVNFIINALGNSLSCLFGGFCLNIFMNWKVYNTDISSINPKNFSNEIIPPHYFCIYANLFSFKHTISIFSSSVSSTVFFLPFSIVQKKASTLWAVEFNIVQKNESNRDKKDWIKIMCVCVCRISS